MLLTAISRTTINADNAKKIKALTLSALVAFFLTFASSASAGTLDFSFWYDEGDTEIHLELEEEIKGLSIATEYHYNKYEPYLRDEEMSLSLGVDPKINEKWSIWVDEVISREKEIDMDTDYGEDEEIKLENFFGVGPKYVIFESDRQKLSYSVGYLHQYQKYEYNGDTSTTNTQRISNRIKYNYKTENTSTVFVVFYQPKVDSVFKTSFDAEDDYIFMSKLSYLVNLSGRLYMKWTIFDYEYRSIDEDPSALESYLSLEIEFNND